jgi:hypothetical protein
MTRAHRSVGGDTGDHGAAWTALTPPVRAVQRPSAAEHGAATGDPPDEEQGASSSGSGIGDVGSVTVSELAIAADLRRVDPSSLLGRQTQARMREVLELAARLPDPVAALTLTFARLDPGTAAVLAGMIERFAAADRRRRPPAP